MKKGLAMLVILLVGGVLVTGQTSKPAVEVKKYPASEAKKLVGKYVVIVGTVVQVRPSEKIIHINFDKPYPYQEFTAVVFASRTNLFPNLDKLIGSKVEVSGKIETYKDKPQIVLQSPKQLRVVSEKTDEQKLGK